MAKARALPTLLVRLTVARFAVMIAEVVGYGRLSQVDEEGTRARSRPISRIFSSPRSPRTVAFVRDRKASLNE